MSIEIKAATVFRLTLVFPLLYATL